MKKIISFIFAILCCSSIIAQELNVCGFNHLPEDISAAVYQEKDANGDPCALIKVGTTVVNPTFEGSVVKTVNKNGEYWVYVTAETFYLTVKSENYLPVRAEFQPVESNNTYELRLCEDKTKPEKRLSGFLIFNTTPSGAQVFVTEGKQERYIGNTPLQQKMPYGTYRYRLKSPLYHDTIGIVEVDGKRVIKDFALKPAFGTVNISTKPSGATVLVESDGRTFTTPCEITKLPSGSHSFNVMHPGYAPMRYTINVTDGSVTPFNLELDTRYSQVTINTLPGATVKINGQVKGNGSIIEQLDEGVYYVEVSLPKHRTATRQIEVVAKQPQTIDINPTPIYGSLDVISNPMYADIIIDGRIYGTTPTTIDDLLIGEYEVTIRKEGCAPVKRQVTISDGLLSTIEVDLPKGTTPQWQAGISPKTKQILQRLVDNMVKVEGGTFLMGAQSTDSSAPNYDEEAYDEDSSPVHQVTISDFSIGKYEVTQEEWEVVMGNNPSEFKGAKNPVERVSWNDVQEFIKRINKMTGMQFRLPTEAEWEYAARGGNKSQGYNYSGGNIFDVAWAETNSTHTVGTKRPNELGIYDMSGNVSEWCSDWFGKYKSSTQTNPVGPSSGTKRVMRGGDYQEWLSFFCSVSYRYSEVPNKASRGSGFRLVLSTELSSHCDNENQGTTQHFVSLSYGSGLSPKTKQILQQLVDNMVKVEGGTFLMGAQSADSSAPNYDAEADDEDSSPVHQVTISDFSIGKYEVTQEEWEVVMGNNPSEFKGAKNPVERVSWDDAQEFIKRLNKMTGMQFCLPTEAEWEYAARGGNKSQGYNYSGGNIFDVAWAETNSTHTVGTKRPNELGIYDMSGNVSEWCSDWFGKYKSSAQTNPVGPSSGTKRVMRGGDYQEWVSFFCTVSYRYSEVPNKASRGSGFRLVLSAE